MERSSVYTYIRRQGLPKGRTPMSTREHVTHHDELIRYIKETWNKVVTEPGPHGGAVFYRNESDQQHLKNFKPFDLEGYWGQRLVQNIHVTQEHQYD